MLVSESMINGGNDILIKVISAEGQVYAANFPSDTLIEEIKNRALNYFYPDGDPGASRYKVIRVINTTTLHDFFTLAQEQITHVEELLLVERRTPEAGALWDLGTVRAPQAATIAAATASLPDPEINVYQPNLQSLLSTNEISHELKKILIALIEAGARLAASGRNYEVTLFQLTEALEDPPSLPVIVDEVITPEELKAKSRASNPIKKANDAGETSKNRIGEDHFKRAEALQRFLDKFYEWRLKIAVPPSDTDISALTELGFTKEDAEKALKFTGNNVPGAASYLIGERGSSVFELVNGLPDGVILDALLKQLPIQRGLLNTRMLIAFIAMVGQSGNATLWLNSQHGSPLLSQISRTYHSEKYCLAVNQFSNDITNQGGHPSTSNARN